MGLNGAKHAQTSVGTIALGEDHFDLLGIFRASNFFIIENTTPGSGNRMNLIQDRGQLRGSHGRKRRPAYAP